MKRKQSDTQVAHCTRSKKPCLCTDQLPTKHSTVDWVSATKTRNFMLNDHLVDWLKEHQHHQTTKSSKNESIYNNGFTSFIMEKGVEFEKQLVKYINDKKLPIVTVSEYITNDSVKQTIDLMKAGTPIIHSAPIRNQQNHTHGIIDFLVRSDYLHKLVDECPLTNEEQVISSPKLGHQFHYVVIDVKFSTLALRADGKHLLNSGNYPAYKAQCLIYTNAIGLIQGYTSQYAFLLGRRWKYTKKDIQFNNYTCLDKLGVIDYKNIDSFYVERTVNAIRWIRENKKHGHKWSVSPPSRPELYPNMCFDSGQWQSEKEKIADKIGEISTIWYCGVKHRNKAFLNGIKSWKDPRCNSAAIGMNGIRAPIVDNILDINRQNVDKIRPKKIINNIHKWKKEGNEMFVDFETLSDIFGSFDSLPSQSSTDMIFMIGVYWKKKGKWKYKNFVCNNTSYQEEYRIMDEFTSFAKSKGNPKLWYWCAEPSFWKRAENRQFDIAFSENDEDKTDHITDNWSLYNWADMCDIFKKEPIVIKDCFKFGLKPIAKAMKKHGLISTSIESGCSSGMTAMTLAWKCYQEFPNPASSPIMQDITKYNKFDVSVMHDILSYLRKNHKKPI